MKKEIVLEIQENAVENRDRIVIMPFEQEDMESHKHRYFELAYVTGGSTEHTMNEQTGILRKGDYFIVDYGIEHSYKNSKNLTLINCLFLPEGIDDTMAGCDAFDELMQVCFIRYYRRHFSKVKTPVNQVFQDEDERVLRLLTGMQQEYKERQIGWEEIFRSRLMEILILTMRKIMRRDLNKKGGEGQSETVLSAIRYFDLHYREHGLLEKFCREYHYSPQYISRKFHQETGMTVLDYIQRVRVEKSCELIVGSDSSIREIAFKVGYENVKYFNQVFQKLIHMSPGEYKKRLSRSN